jgi:hypothetical protein
MAGAHRSLNDMFRAFETTGPGHVQDPGSGGTIEFKLWGQICSVDTTSGGSRTLAQPIRPGIVGTVALETDGGDLTLTVTGGYNQPGDTTITMADAGDFATLISVKVGDSYVWREFGTAEELAVVSSTPSSTPSATPSHTPS